MELAHSLTFAYTPFLDILNQWEWIRTRVINLSSAVSAAAASDFVCTHTIKNENQKTNIIVGYFLCDFY